MIYLQLATFATYLYGMSASVPLLRAELGVSQAVAGLHGTVMALGGIAGGLPSPAAAARVPYGWRFHVAGFTLLCCVALEFAFNLWAAALFGQRTGLSPGVAATALTAMLAGMAVGRFGGARLALRFTTPGSVLLGAGAGPRS